MADRYRQLFMSLGDAVFIEDFSGKVIEANTAASWMLGRPAQELAGQSSMDFVAPAQRERVAGQRQMLATVERHQFDTQYVTSTGSTINVLVDISVLPDSKDDKAAGDLKLYVVIVRQISNRDELERELRLQRHSSLINFRTTISAKFFVSARNEIGRYPPLAPGEKPRPLDWVCDILLGPQLKPALDSAWKGQEVALAPAWYSPSGKNRLASGSGSEEGEALVRQRWLEIIVHPLRLRGTEVTDVCVRVWDRTDERLEKEEHRWQEQRQLITLQTQLLFNDFNNHLSVILAQASGLRLTLPAEQLPPPAIGGIIDAAQQAAGLLRRALESAQSESERQSLAVNPVAADCGTALAHMAKGRLNVAVTLAPELPAVAASSELVKGMIMSAGRHIIQNVRSGGRLSVKTYVVPNPQAGGAPSVGISIGDDSRSSQAGPGNNDVPSDSADLTMARSIVRSLRGQIEVISSGTQSATIEITLPPYTAARPAPPKAGGSGVMLSQPSVVPAAPSAPKPVRTQPAMPVIAPSPSSPCKILLADDEENFRMFTSWALREKGFDVVAAKDGQEAFERFQEAPESYQLVILDAYMPRMGGLEAYLRMQILRPELPVLFASGFARGPSVDALVAGCPGPAAVLLKPFSSEDLINAVNQALIKPD